MILYKSKIVDPCQKRDPITGHQKKKEKKNEKKKLPDGVLDDSDHGGDPCGGTTRSKWVRPG